MNTPRPATRTHHPRPAHLPPPAPRPAPAARIRAWAELLRAPALFTVPGDVLAGAAATGRPPTRRTALAAGASLCLYEAGMALNDWADRTEDAAVRPHRPLPSGRIRPGAALAAAGALSAAGLALAACAGRRTLALAVPLTATVWAYDLGLKHTPAGPPAMATARALDLLLGAAATTGTPRPALAPATVLAAHTLTVTLVSRREAEGGSSAAPLAALAAAGALTAVLAGRRPTGTLLGRHRPTPAPADALRTALAASYATAYARPLAHAVLNPSPQLTQRAVGGGIRATIAVQGALAARAGAPATAVLTAALAPLAARLARKVSTT
ncbi:putative transferase [Streptomyces ambofaciens ATCC 23877]|uniref:Putative transferase n=1 Tax=Streptomyces ambofaciens (strain ATCC 23877 / 3486 / DSM 40053 / JCM 4204 / NBRC 12836 / NRRL B-2516) TaxID=278992 RepID=A0A0K2AJH9_STRA7|nr:putative transferase [Streptomyces ambofaciens ATCC 23877]